VIGRRGPRPGSAGPLALPQRCFHGIWPVSSEWSPFSVSVDLLAAGRHSVTLLMAFRFYITVGMAPANPAVAMAAEDGPSFFGGLVLQRRFVIFCCLARSRLADPGQTSHTLRLLSRAIWTICPFR
jgi:hypothetical protein